jgi:hypothetical protein
VERWRTYLVDLVSSDALAIEAVVVFVVSVLGG